MHSCGRRRYGNCISAGKSNQDAYCTRASRARAMAFMLLDTTNRRQYRCRFPTVGLDPRLAHACTPSGLIRDRIIDPDVEPRFVRSVSVSRTVTRFVVHLCSNNLALASTTRSPNQYPTFRPRDITSSINYPRPARWVPNRHPPRLVSFPVAPLTRCRQDKGPG